jgi:hypothetical protein
MTDRPPNGSRCAVATLLLFVSSMLFCIRVTARVVTCAVPIKGQDDIAQSHSRSLMGKGWRYGFYLPDQRFFYPGKTGYFVLTDNATVARRVPLPVGIAENGSDEATRLADGRVLLHGSKGWFLLQNHGDHFERIGGPALSGKPRPIQAATSPSASSRGGLLEFDIKPEKFGGHPFIPSTADQVRIWRMQDGGALIWADHSWFILAHGEMSLKPVAPGSLVGGAYIFSELTGGDVLILAEGGLFRIAHLSWRFEKILDAGQAKSIAEIHSLASGAALIEANQAWLVLHGRSLDKISSSEPTGKPIRADRDNESKHYFPLPSPYSASIEVDESGRALIFTQAGLFALDADEKHLTRIPAPRDMGEILRYSESYNGGTVILTAHGILLLPKGELKLSWMLQFEPSGARVKSEPGALKLVIPSSRDADPMAAENTPKGIIQAVKFATVNTTIHETLILVFGKIYLLKSGATTLQLVDQPANLPSYARIASLRNGRTYVSDTKNLFLLNREHARLERVQLPASLDDILEIDSLANGDAIITSAAGLFILSEKTGQVEQAAMSDARWRVSGIVPAPQWGAMIWLENTDPIYTGVDPVDEVLNLVKAEMNDARVRFDISDTAALSERVLLPVSVQSSCAAALWQWHPVLKVTGPETKSPSDDILKPIQISPKETKFEYAFARAGPYRLELWLSDLNTMVGRATYIRGQAAGPKQLQSWMSLAAATFGTLLVIANLGLFAAARRSPWALRVALDGSLGSSALRILTIMLTHFSWPQIWIVDLYFQRCKRSIGPAAPLLSLPLTSEEDGHVRESELVVMQSWEGRRIWVRGNSGMGKTTLFSHATGAHFRVSASSVDAFSAEGYVIVAFSARQFATGGSDEFDATWVIEAVRATLSQAGVTFADEKLLRRILQTGTLAVAIDGLHEAGRFRAVEAFAYEFDQAPLFVTSQERGPKSFENWRLPEDMSAFVADLIRLHCPPPRSDVLLGRIHESGLYSAVQSGYDVRLLLDLAANANDPATVPLPADRLTLYDAVVEAGWSNGPAEKKREEQGRVMAAAWSMVSERRPNQDKRRLDPKTDALLSEDLLTTLADAPDRELKPVRLVQRVRGAYEFVHDQMHEYLAACYFARSGFGEEKMVKLLIDSTLWDHADRARRPLWTFVANLLEDQPLIDLWSRVEEPPEWDILRRALKKEVERRHLRR